MRPPRQGAALLGARIYYGLNLLLHLVIGGVLLFMTWMWGVMLFTGGLSHASYMLVAGGVVACLWMFLVRAWKLNQRFLRNEEVPGGYYWTLPGLAFAAFIVYAVAVPKFADLTRGMQDGATRGNLGAIRSALSIYYGDMEGVYPERPESLTIGGKYLSTLPSVKVREHDNTDAFTYLPELEPMDSGAWGYVNDPYGANMGTLFVDCSHTDSRGKLWHTY